MTTERRPVSSGGRFEDASVDDLLDEIAGEECSPAGSSVAALSVSLAAALAAKSARRSLDTNEAAGFAAEADSLRRRALALASTNANAYSRAVVVLGTRSDNQTHPDARRSARDVEIREALLATNRALVDVLEVASDVCLLAALVAERGAPEARADAGVAATHAEAGARAAVQLIEISLLSGGPDDPIMEAHDLLAATTAASERAIAASR